MRVRPRVGLSLLPGDDLRLASQPLFAAGLVEALEWTIDTEFGATSELAAASAAALPPWVEPLLDHYAAEGALYGHGVHFSPLSAQFEARQQRWLAQARRALERRPYRHLSEHFGFSTVPGLAQGAPLPLPFDSGAVALGRERLRMLEDAASAPVGLENLALAMSRDDVLLHGEFLDALLDPTGGFLLLDLHNLYCQAVNFDVPPEDLLLAMPLERVREVHLSGGRWATVATPEGPGRFRRDTHDGAIPEEVLALLELALRRCPRLEAVFVERLSGTLGSAHEVERYRDDYRRVFELTAERGAAAEPSLSASSPGVSAARGARALPETAMDDVELAALQLAFSESLRQTASPEEARARLERSNLPEPARRWLARCDPRSLQTAIEIAARWSQLDTAAAAAGATAAATPDAG